MNVEQSLENGGIRIIQLPKIADQRGNLSFIEEQRHIPFAIERAYWLYDVPGGEIRGSHAFINTHEFIVALSGSFDVHLDDGKQKHTFTLNRSYMGLYVPNMVWRSIQNFSTNSLCLILASHPYNENEYIRSYEQFQQQAR